MVKKKLSGQTIAIIILTVLLVLTIGFGGVYAYQTARSKKVTGKIVMANLTISMEAGGSEKSEIVISNGVNIVPGQPLENSALTIHNKSSVEVYLVVVYQIDAETIADEKEDRVQIVDEFKGSLIDIDVEYINPIQTEYSTDLGVGNKDWIDYVFYGEQEDKYYRCLVSTKSYGETAVDNPIVVIGEDKMSLSGYMSNAYQNTNITLTFQAYAIASDSGFQFNKNTTKTEKCEEIVDKIYFSQGYSFLSI